MAEYFFDILMITPFFYLLPLYVARALFGVKTDRVNIAAYFITSGGSILIIFWIFNSPDQLLYIMSSSFILMLVMFYIYIKTDKATIIFSFLISGIILITCEFIGFLVYTTNFAQSIFLNDGKFTALKLNLIPFLFSYIVVYIIYLVKKIKIDIRITEEQESIFVLAIVLIIILTSVLIILDVEIFILENIDNPGIQRIFVKISLFVILTILICVMFIRQTFREKKKNLVLEQVQEALVELYDTTRMFRHNYKNSLISLEGYRKGHDMNGLKEALSGLSQEINDKGVLECIPDIVKIKDSGLRWLLLSKYLAAHKKDIVFSVLVVSDIDIKLLAKNDLHSVIGILLDNALDAAFLSQEKTISISMVKEDEDVLISIRNSFVSKPDMTKIFDKSYTLKEGHEGLGLYSARRILRKYENTFFDISVNDSIFQVNINIHNGSLAVE